MRLVAVRGSLVADGGCRLQAWCLLAVPVVEVSRQRQASSSPDGGMVDEAVGPFPQQRQDESFGLAVGAWPIGWFVSPAALDLRDSFGHSCGCPSGFPFSDRSVWHQPPSPKKLGWTTPILEQPPDSSQPERDDHSPAPDPTAPPIPSRYDREGKSESRDIANPPGSFMSCGGAGAEGKQRVSGKRKRSPRREPPRRDPPAKRPPPDSPPKGPPHEPPVEDPTPRRRKIRLPGQDEEHEPKSPPTRPEPAPGSSSHSLFGRTACLERIRPDPR